jgi:hypothetical protein
MIDTVRVAPDTFKSLTFLSADERKEYVEGQNIPHRDKKQQVNREGVPVWSIQLAAVPWRGRGRVVKVNVPSSDNPGDRIEPGELVTLSDMEFGVTPKREGGGYIIWLRAAEIDTVTAAARKPSAVSAA